MSHYQTQEEQYQRDINAYSPPKDNHLAGTIRQERDLSLVGLSSTTQPKAYLPSLEGVVEIATGVDGKEAKENYLQNLCDMITVLQQHKAKILSGEETLEVFL